MATEDKTEPAELGGPNVGLAMLNDETLARIVEAEIEQYGELKHKHAIIAFEELARRSGHNMP
jgi:hypothetical protein